MKEILKDLQRLKTKIDDYKPEANERGLLNLIKRYITLANASAGTESRVKAGDKTLAALLNPRYQDKQTKPSDAPTPKAGGILATSDDVKTPIEQLKELSETEPIKKPKRRRGRPKK